MLIFAIALSLAFSLALSEPCCACLWDSDTLAMERRRFPEAHELIAGHFLRHSDTYYQWRIFDRKAVPADQRRPMDFDDIAVAYDKLGQHDKAIETILSKMQRWPKEQRYESEANLGTFHIHAGRFKEGLKHIKKAIAINPEAHFGREVYQKRLVEYLVSIGGEEVKLPLRREGSFGNGGFATFLLADRELNEREVPVEINNAVKGVLGMMRFGHYDSPILLETLGDLLMYGRGDDSKRLAARAYLKASYGINDPSAVTAYREKASKALERQVGKELPDLEKDMKFEIEQGNNFFGEISAKEKAWLAAGANLDTEFSKLYHESPKLSLRPPASRFKRNAITVVVFGTLFTLIAMVIGAMVLEHSDSSDPDE